MKMPPIWSLVRAKKSAQRTEVCLPPCHSPKSFPNDSGYSDGLQCHRTLLHTNTHRKLRDPTLSQPSCCSEKFIHPFYKPIVSLPARQAHSEGLGTAVTELPSAPQPHGAFSLVRNKQSGSVLLIESIRITWIFLKSFTGRASPKTWGPQPLKDSECSQGSEELNLPIWKGNSWHRVLSAHQPSRKGGEKSRASQRWLPELAISRHKSVICAQDLPTTPVHFHFTLSRWVVGFLTLVSLNYIILNICPFVHRHQEQENISQKF